MALRIYDATFNSLNQFFCVWDPSQLAISKNQGMNESRVVASIAIVSAIVFRYGMPIVIQRISLLDLSLRDWNKGFCCAATMIQLTKEFLYVSVGTGQGLGANPFPRTDVSREYGFQNKPYLYHKGSQEDQAPKMAD